MTNFSYPSKVLLFGEYTVLLGSKAFALPNPQYSGSLELFDMYNTDFGIKIKKSNTVLKQLLGYLKDNSKDSSFPQLFDHGKFEDDIRSGLFFCSNIPERSGLGSSGALVAAVYHKYVLNSKFADTENIGEIKRHMAFIESYFHQISSGVDPLVSLLNRPLLFVDSDITVKEVNEIRDFQNIYTLVDSNIKRITGNLVEEFRQNMQDNTFKTAIEEKLIPLNNWCIEAYIQGDRAKLFEQLYNLSEFQFKYMKWLIPSPMQQLWKEGLETGNFYKLCGAGGGGFFLKFNN